MQTEVKDDILKDMKIISESERKKAQQLLKQLSLSEKCSLLTGKDYWHIQGIPRLHLPDMMVSDGPSGLRKQEGKFRHAPKQTHHLLSVSIRLRIDF